MTGTVTVNAAPLPTITITSVSRDPVSGHFLIDGVSQASLTLSLVSASDLGSQFNPTGETAMSDGSGLFHFDDATAATALTQFYKVTIP